MRTATKNRKRVVLVFNPTNFKLPRCESSQNAYFTGLGNVHAIKFTFINFGRLNKIFIWHLIIL